jgi:hypothetical protein
MNCRRVGQLLSEELEGFLSEGQFVAVSAHLARCPVCCQLRDDLASTRAELRDVGRRLSVHGAEIDRRAIDRWMAERTTGSQSRSLRHPARLAPLAGTAAALALAALTLLGWGHRRSVLSGRPTLAPATHPAPTASREQGSRVARLTPTSQVPRSGGTEVFADRVRANSVSGLLSTRRPEPAQAGFAGTAGGFNRRGFGTRPGITHPRRPARVTDDLIALNRDPEATAHQWLTLRPDEWERIEAGVRRDVQVRDDFVRIPFPRLVSTADRQIAAAVDSYKREAAIVDPRLSREVTSAFKATALSDLCERLRADSGIQLVAGSSVADEKVTLFCEKLPLREVMRQLSRPFGYTWLRSGAPPSPPNVGGGCPRSGRWGGYRYELVQDLKSQLLEEELRNRDRRLALLALEKEIDRYRPFLQLTPDEALARSKTAPPGEKELLETLAGRGWAVLQMYRRLSSQDQAALRAGKQLRFQTRPVPGDQSLPPDVQQGVLQAFRDWKVVRDGDQYKMAFEPDTPGAVSASSLPVTITETYVGLQIGQSELGRIGLHGDVYWNIPDNRVGGGGSDVPYVVGQSPFVLQPDNQSANAKFARDPALRPRVTVAPIAGRRLSDASGGVGHQTKDAADSPLGTNGPHPSTPDPFKVTSADVLEALHRATGMPVVSDYYTRLFKPETVTVRGLPLFETLNRLGEAMRTRWTRDAGTREAGAWLQFRSASYYDDRLKEVPNRLLDRWAASRRKNGALTLDDLIEIAQLPDAQLNGREMGEGARELYGLKEWDLGSNGNLRGSLRFLAGFTSGQRQEATTTAGLAFTQMSLAQQQRYIALALETSGQPLQSLDDLTGATLRVEYTQPGWFQWGDPNHPGRGYYNRWVIPVETTPRGRRVPRPPVRERTRAAALQAVQRVNPELQQALLRSARRANPRLDDSLRTIEEDQIFPTKLDLTIVYIPGATNVRDLHVRCPDANYNPGLE